MVVLARPIWFALYSVNQSAPSEPAVISVGVLLDVGVGYSAIEPPPSLILPILPVPDSANQSAPSFPAVMP